MNLINLVSAHTGNDYYDHRFEFYDGLIGLILFIGIVISIIFLIKYKRNKK
jgi:hypothetical protein